MNKLPVPSQKCVYVKSKFLTCPSCLPLDMFSLHVVSSPLSKKERKKHVKKRGRKKDGGRKKQEIQKEQGWRGGRGKRAERVEASKVQKFYIKILTQK